MEPPADQAANAAATAVSLQSSGAGDLGALSKKAGHEMFAEFSASALQTRAASSAAWNWLRQGAERRLGIEVSIEDPALRELFGLHVVAVEDLCGRVRAQAEAVLAAAEEFGHTDFGGTAAWLRPLAGGDDAADGDAQALENELLDAGRASAIARTRLEGRMRDEVFTALEQRLETHARVREDVRERKTWNTLVDRRREDVAYMRKSLTGSGLNPISGRSTSIGSAEVDAKLMEALEKVGELDSRILAGLLEMQADSVDTVRRPWAALLQIQSEYFMAQQAMWAPLGSAFRECVE